MDAFEDLVARLLRREGYWTRQNYRVNITKPDKASLGRPSLPRPELDILAYRVGDNRLALVECKSYLDSGGVHIDAFNNKNEVFKRRFKMFTDPALRELVTARLVEQVVAEGLTLPDPTVEYWLVAGKIAKGSLDAVTTHFASQVPTPWVLKGREWIRTGLLAMAGEGYEDDVVTMAAKLLREPE